MNYFAHTPAAERYAKGRPYFHPLVIERIAQRYPHRLPFPHALDVGCGTGNSTRALAQIAQQIVGTDVSPEMLSQTHLDPKIRYVQAQAEALPFANHSFDLITSCMAFHWFDQGRFLQEAKRLLKPEAPIVIYGHGFHGAMAGNLEFALWHDEVYLKHYPIPPRLTPDQSRMALENGWLQATEAFEHHIPMTPEQFADYLMTQSNVIAKVEEGQESAAEVYRWLLDELKPFFKQPKEDLLFHGLIWYCQKP